MDNTKPMTFVSAIRSYFGFKPNQTMGEFMAELKELDDADRAYFKAGLIAAGYVII